MTEERRARDDGVFRVRSAHAKAAPLLVLAFVLALVAVRASSLKQAIDVARLSQAELESDEDLYRGMPILGPEYPILARLRKDYPRGTPVALPLSGAAVTRGQRFWLPLLPGNPIVGDAELVICAMPCSESGLSLVQRGKEFGLMRRGETKREQTPE